MLLRIDLFAIDAEHDALGRSCVVLELYWWLVCLFFLGSHLHDIPGLGAIDRCTVGLASDYAF